MTDDQLDILLQGQNFLHSSGSVHTCDLERLITLSKTRPKYIKKVKGTTMVNYKKNFLII